MQEKRIASKRQVFAVVRVDDYFTEPIDPIHRFSVVKVTESQDFAEQERERLQALKTSGGSRYFVLATRFVEFAH
jgi:hypothetical protein